VFMDGSGRKVRAVTVGAMMLIAVIGAFAEEASVIDVMREVDQLRQVRETLRAEQVEWETRKASMEHGMMLLEREKEQLTARIAEAGERMDERSEEEVQRERRRTDQEQALRGVDRWMDDHSDVSARARAAFPESFETSAGDEAVAERLRRILAAASTIHRRSRTVSVEPVLMDAPDATRRRMDVLYLGLAQAYAVSPDNSYAAHGVWAGTAWEWTWNADWADAFRHAVRIHQGDVASRWVSLPIAVVGDESP